MMGEKGWRRVRRQRMRGQRLMAEDKGAEGAEGVGTKRLVEGDGAEGVKSEGLAEIRRG